MTKEKTVSSKGIERRTLFALAGTILLISALLFFRLGDRSFRNPDEGRYAEAAREILQSGDWLEPTLFGIGYIRKPILFYWLIAASFKTFGLNEWAARLVPALSALFGVVAVFWFSIRYFGPRTAILSSILLGTNLWYLQVGRYLVIDPAFTTLIILCLFSFYAGFHSEKRSYAWMTLSYVLGALAFLAKGLIAIAIPAVSIGAYLVLTRRLLSGFARTKLFLGIPVFALVAAPWYFLMEQRRPGFLEFFFGHEHWQRLVSSGFEHQEPWFFYFAVFPLMLLPWLLFWKPTRLAFGREKEAVQDDAVLFLGASLAATLLFFSVSRSKMPTYVLPCLPLAVILLARGWERWIRSSPKLGKWEYGPIIFMAAAAVGLMVFPDWYLQRHAGKFPEEVASTLKILGGGLLAGCVLCLRSVRRGSSARLFYSLAATMGIVSLLFTFTIEAVNRLYSTKAFALHLEAQLSGEDRVFVYDHPGPFYDFPFYLDRSVRVVGLEGELEHSRKDPRAAVASIGREAFLDLLKKDTKLYCLIRKSDFRDLEASLDRDFRVLKEDERKVLFVSGAVS